MISRLYTWEVPLPAGRDPGEALKGADAGARRVVRFNPNVSAAHAVFDQVASSLTITIDFQGRDQWWIKKWIPYAIGAILSAAKLPHAGAKLVRLERPEDSRSTRQRASDGRHNPIPEDQDICHADMMAADQEPANGTH